MVQCILLIHFLLIHLLEGHVVPPYDDEVDLLGQLPLVGEAGVIEVLLVGYANLLALLGIQFALAHEAIEVNSFHLFYH
jgi:hypothetical protein